MVSNPEGKFCHKKEVCIKRWKIGKRRCRKKAKRWVGYDFKEYQEDFAKGRFVLRVLKMKPL